MAAGAYSHTAALLAQTYNLNRSEDDEVITADDINPYKSRVTAKATPEFEEYWQDRFEAGWLHMCDQVNQG